MCARTPQDIYCISKIAEDEEEENEEEETGSNAAAPLAGGRVRRKRCENYVRGAKGPLTNDHNFITSVMPPACILHAWYLQ